ncbi:MAG: GNAT family N-acetyltransferase [Propionivibrio sp.]|jgi:GNAT superfamily N-acetyltransferase|nr:GNAT family N-acetyltransferase [Propionivibrio sp.]MBP6710206.1 GNAT family N-acetyltransferase [Propionivibrio sp.]MBP7526021.1 GNAT family N-acetyltransferase [Propionivibrio sp.]MBP8163602.1 GNAT family N-acetyltransferase [Propionivibrio sp.]
MAPDYRVIAVTDDAGELREPAWLARAESVHRQLRPQLPPEYEARLQVIFAAGARMALVVDADSVCSVALWRVVENTYEGRRLYVDDLVSDETRRSSGAGKMLLDWLQAKAESLGCDVLALDSGVQRDRAHRFYFREGMHISSFCFRKVLK